MPSPAYRHGAPVLEGFRATRAPNESFRNKFQKLPPPTYGAPYFRLKLSDVLGTEEIQQIESSHRLVFHSGGDSGGIKNPVPQRNVAYKMVGQLRADDQSERPSFFYHLGDVVYHKGEASEYYSQFYDAYEHYSAPIFAIPGNHDGNWNADDGSLGAFMRNFCSEEAVVTPEAVDLDRTAMIQPNCYFTLQTPVVTLIGLYSNVPEGGVIEQDQRDWFFKELAAAPKDIPVVVAVHHPAFSLDKYHSGSEHIRDVIDGVCEEANRLPHLVLTAHVHNYQRFTRIQNGGAVPYLVAGAAGYHNLHSLGSEVETPYKVPGSDDLTLESYKDDRHSFLRISVDAKNIITECFTVPRPHESWSAPAKLHDKMVFNWKDRSFA